MLPPPWSSQHGRPAHKAHKGEALREGDRVSDGTMSKCERQSCQQRSGTGLEQVCFSQMLSCEETTLSASNILTRSFLLRPHVPIKEWRIQDMRLIILPILS